MKGQVDGELSGTVAHRKSHGIAIAYRSSPFHCSHHSQSVIDGVPCVVRACTLISHTAHRRYRLSFVENFGVSAEWVVSSRSRLGNSARCVHGSIAGCCSAMSAMLNRVLAIATYVETYKRMGAADACVKVQQDQAQHVLLLLKSEVLDVSDAATLITALGDGDGSNATAVAAFSREQRQAMVAAVQVKKTIEDPKSTSQPQQTHYFFHNYMSEGDWKVLLGNVDSYVKVNTLVSRALDVGLTHPSELTVVALIALITVTSRTPVHPETAHTLLKEYKRINKSRRGGVRQSVLTFPKDVKEFRATFTDAFADSPPHNCPLTDEQIDRERSQLAARKTHRSLSSGGQSPSSSKSSSTADPSAILAALTSAIMQVGRFPVERNEGRITFLNQAAPAAPKPIALGTDALAIADVPVVNVRANAPMLALPPPPTPVAGSLEDSLRAVAAALDVKKGAAKQSKTGMKRPAAASADEGDGDGDCTTAERVGTKRPSAHFISTRNCVTARTGLDGPGQSKSVSVKSAGSKAKAMKAAREWLQEKCEEMGIKCDLDGTDE